MKKLSLLFLTIVSLTVLIACESRNDANISVNFTISEGTLSTTGVSINIDVIDLDNAITGVITAKIVDSTNRSAGQDQTFQSVNDAKLLVYRSLIPDNTYKVTLTATTSRTSVEIGEFSFRTLSLLSLNISTTEEFLAMGSNRTGAFVLQNDLDFTDVVFTTPFTSAFTGSFDGQGFTISNISITDSRLYNGVFGYISSGSVKDLTLDNISIGTEATPITTSSSTKTGILAGYQASSLSTLENITIKNSHIFLSSSSSLYAYVGGIVGELRGTASNIEVTNTSVNVAATSNGTLRVGGAYGLIFESGKANNHHIYIDVTASLDAVTSTRANRSYNINIGGFAGEVDPSSTSSGAIHSIYHVGDVNVPKLNFNPVANDTGTYTVLVGGLFGNLNRGIHNIYTKNSLIVVFNDDLIPTFVSKTLRVNGISALYNTFDAPYKIVLDGNTLNVSHPENARVQIFSGLNIYTTDALNDYVKTINQIIDTSTNVNIISSIDDYFDSEYLNNIINS
jgi:hypothetical protein